MAWPLRTTRTQIGPKWRNSKPVVRRDTSKSADSQNLTDWIAAGLSQSSPRAWALISGTTVLEHGEAWAPNGGPAPVVVNSSTGVYAITYPATANDHNDVPIPIDLKAAKVSPQTTSCFIGRGTAAGNVVQARIFDNSAVPQSATFLLEVY